MNHVFTLCARVDRLDSGDAGRQFFWFEVGQHALAVAPDGRVQDWSMFLFHVLIMIYFPTLVGLLGLVGVRGAVAFSLVVTLINSFFYAAGQYMAGTRIADEAFWPGPTEQVAFLLLTLGAIMFGLLFRRSN